MPSGNKPLFKLISTKSYVAIWRHNPTLIVRRAGLLWSQQDFEWRWSVPLFKCLTVLEFSFILFDLCLLITFFNFIMNYVPIVTFWIFTYHKIWILSIMFCFIWSYWIIYFLACLEVSCLNSLGPSHAIWRQRSGSTFAQVMACCLMTSRHYLNQCWLIIDNVEWHSSKASSQEITQPSITEIIWIIKYLKISFKFPRGQWVKSLSHGLRNIKHDTFMLETLQSINLR